MAKLFYGSAAALSVNMVLRVVIAISQREYIAFNFVKVLIFSKSSQIGPECIGEAAGAADNP